MRSSLKLIMCLAATVLFVTACSTTTVVSSDSRVTPQGQTSDRDTSDGDSSVSGTSGSDTSDGGEAGDSTGATTGEDDADDGADRGDRDLDDEGESPQTPRELEEAEGFGLGGAIQLGAMLTDCESGSDLACDILFQLSDFDSIEEAAALTCGGRSDTEVLFCSDGINTTGDQLVFDLDSPGLDQIVTQCRADGDMTACDFLYFRSPVGSTFEQIGATCGERVDVAVPDCRTFLAE